MHLYCFSDDPTYEPVERKFEPLELKNSRFPDHVEVQNDGYPKQDYVTFDHEMLKRDIEIVKTPSRDADPTKPLPAPAIISQSMKNLDDEEYYDKLDFFGSTSRLNAAGYKQVFPIPIPPVRILYS